MLVNMMHGEERSGEWRDVNRLYSGHTPQHEHSEHAARDATRGDVEAEEPQS